MRAVTSLCMAAAFSLILPLAAHAGQEGNHQHDSACYSHTLNSIHRLVSSYHEGIEYEDGAAGIFEAVAYQKATAENIGFAIRDINGDGISELIISAITEKKDQKKYGSKTYAVFSCVNGEVRSSLEGTARNAFWYTGKGTFFNYGSDGASTTIAASFTLSSKGAPLTLNDFYFSAAKIPGSNQSLYFHNTSGSMDPAASIKLEAASFASAIENLKDAITYIELTPFSEYAPSKKQSHGSKALVQAKLAEGALPAGCQEFIADTTAPQTRILLTTEGRIENFKVLELTLLDVDDNGKPNFSTKTLHSCGISSEQPLLLTITIYGSVPRYGIGYMDEEGSIRKFSIGLSGEDGSLLLTPF